MKKLRANNLTLCHVCSQKLWPHPLYEASGTMYCPDDGDFFVQKLRGQKPTVTFRPFDRDEPAPKKIVKRRVATPTIRHEKIAIPQLPVVPRLIPRDFVASPHPIRRQTRSGHPGITIRCDQTGDIFPSLTKAADALDVNKNALSLHMNNQARHVNGYTFTKIDDLADENQPFVKKPRLRPGGGAFGERIRCEPSGVVFHSVRDAAAQLKLSRKHITKHVQDSNNCPLLKDCGYRFTPEL